MSTEKIILGIETSCDESAIALVAIKSDGTSRVIGEVISSQIDLHKQYGGVVPELASREHLKALPLLYKAIEIKYPEAIELVSAIAVTKGPGLKGCLLIGINFAKGLALSRNVPLIGVNHIEGHLYSGFLNKTPPQNSFLALIVSGGHTELIHVEKFGSYSVIARTIDDAAGEAFDKSAHILGFPYPGGRALSECAVSGDTSLFILPKVMKDAKGFSFSGLKTAIQQLIRKNPVNNEKIRSELCFTIEQSIVDALLMKVTRAISDTTVSLLTVVGGVSANRVLRLRSSSLCQQHGMSLVLPEYCYATDNAAMIALAGGLRLIFNGMPSHEASLSMEVLPRYPLEETK